MILPPGDTGQCLGTPVFVTTGGAPGVEWVGSGMLLSPQQCPEWPHKEEPDPNVSSAEGQTLSEMIWKIRPCLGACTRGAVPLHLPPGKLVRAKLISSLCYTQDPHLSTPRRLPFLQHLWRSWDTQAWACLHHSQGPPLREPVQGQKGPGSPVSTPPHACTQASHSRGTPGAWHPL